MERVHLTESIYLSRIIQGTMGISLQNRTPQETLSFMKQCVELGVTTFDTAEIYGNYSTEDAIGEALKLDPSFRSQIQLITKTGINMASSVRPYAFSHYDTSRERIVAACQESLRKMNSDYIDVYLVHREDPLIDHQEVACTLIQLKQEGLIKSYGVSNFDPFKFEALHEATGYQLVTNQIEWNPLVTEHIDNGNFDVLQKHGVKPMIWSPLAQGRLFDLTDKKTASVAKVLGDLALKYGVDPEVIAYAYLLRHPVHAMPISGSTKIERLKNAVKALDVHLEREDWYRIYLASGQKHLR